MAAARKCLTVVVFLCAALLGGNAYGYAVGNFDVYQYAQPQGNLVPVSDVDKAGVPPAAEPARQ